MEIGRRKLLGFDCRAKLSQASSTVFNVLTNKPREFLIGLVDRSYCCSEITG